MTAPLVARGIQVGYDAVIVVDGVDLAIPRGQTTGLIGANGSGKSTLLRALGRALPLAAGTVLLDGEAIHTLPSRAVARRLGLLPQDPRSPPGMTVRELVALGRHPHRAGFGLPTRADRAAIDDALARTALTDLQDRALDALSGGQRQRAWIALALCQQAAIMLLDEPTTFLDVAHQMEVLAIIDATRAAGRTIVVVLHDLLQAARTCDHLVALAGGAIVAWGTPAEVLTPPILKAVFGIDARVLTDPCTGRPLVVPVPPGVLGSVA